MKPKLAAFPKCYIDELCVHRTMTLSEWIELAATLGVDGLEFYSGFLEDDPSFIANTKEQLDRHHLAMPMLCCSPDFTQPDPVLLQREIDREKRMIEMTALFGGRFCRVLSGQRRPESLARQASIKSSGSSPAFFRPRKKMASSLRWRTTIRTTTGSFRNSLRRWMSSLKSSTGSNRHGSELISILRTRFLPARILSNYWRQLSIVLFQCTPATAI